MLNLRRKVMEEKKGKVSKEREEKKVKCLREIFLINWFPKC